MSRAKIVLTNEERRVEAAKWISNAPVGTRVEFKAPRRSLPQNDRMWAMLSDVSTQLRWHGQHLTANDWKLVFLDALDKETRTCPDIYGIGRVNLGRSSSDLSKDEMSQLMELMAAFGSQHGVKFHDDPIDHIKTPRLTQADRDKKDKLAADILNHGQVRASYTKPKVPEAKAGPKLTRAEIMAKARAAKAAKAAEKPAGKADRPIVVEFVAPPKTSPEPSKAAQRPPATTEDYLAYAQAQILANKGKVSPAIMETWFMSDHEKRLREDCKVGQLVVQMLHSLILESA